MGTGCARPDAGDQDLSKTFTLGEAQTLLPVVEALLRRAQAAGARAGELESEMQQLSHRIFLSGGMHVDVSAAARRRAEREKAVQEARDTVAEIDSIGVQVNDLARGAAGLSFCDGWEDGVAVLEAGGAGDYSLAYGRRGLCWAQASGFQVR